MESLRANGRVPGTVWLGSVGVTPEAYLAALASVVTVAPRSTTVAARSDKASWSDRRIGVGPSLSGLTAVWAVVIALDLSSVNGLTGPGSAA